MLQTRRAFLASSCAAVLASCGQSSTQNSGTTLELAASELHRGNVAEPGSLDPHFATSANEIAILDDLLIPLTAPGADGRPIPGAALSWETSPDGKTWTFHLRDHSWSDGTPVTAEDFVYSWRRILDPKTAASYASILYLFKNAEAINAGKMAPEQLGVRAVDERTIELSLENPAPYLPELMMHVTTFPVKRSVIEKFGREWTKPGNFVGNGPYTLAEWIPNDHITTVKNAKFFDAAGVHIERVIYYPISDGDAAFKRYRAGEIDTLYTVPATDVAFVKANMADQFHVEPQLGAGWYTINMARKPFNDVRVRMALNLAYDRDTIAYKILPFGNISGYSLVPPGIANYPHGVELDFKSLPYEMRVARAQELMRQAGYGPDRRLKMSFLEYEDNTGKRVAAVAQANWKAVYIDTDIVQQDPRTFNVNKQAGNYDICAGGWGADFNDARNFLFIFMSDNGLNDGHYKNLKFDALIRQSDVEQDPMKRGAILAEAEAMLLKDSPIIPTRFPPATDLIETYVKGWITNPMTRNPSRWLSLERPPAKT